MKKQLISYIENDEYLKARQTIDEILLQVLPTNPSKYYQVNNAILYIQENYRNTLTLSDVAKHAGVSTNYFCKVFQMHTGMRFTEYLNFIRIKHAEILLITTDFRITRISEAVGCSDSSYFIRLFRKYTHLTPSQFRQKYNHHHEII